MIATLGKALLFLTSLTCGELPLLAQDPARSDTPLEVRLLDAEFEFGKPFRLLVQQSEPSAYRLQPAPFIENDLLTGTLARNAGDPEGPVSLVYECRVFRSGQVRIQGLRLEARDKQGLRQLWELPPFEIKLRSSLTGKDPAVELPFAPFPAPTRWAAWITLSSSLVAIGLVTLVIVRRLRTRFHAKTVATTPAERALERLATLQNAQPVGFDALHEDAVHSSGILREFVADSFGAPALRQTTTELAESGTIAERMDEVHCSTLRLELEYCDRIKFARTVPLAEQRSERLNAIETFVLETRTEADSAEGSEVEA